MRDISHPHAVSRDAAVSADGSARANPASGLDALRHGPRCLPTSAHDARRTRAWICLDLPAAVFACFDLASAAAAVTGNPVVCRDVVSVQAFESLLASADQARPGQSSVEAPGRDDTTAACPLPEAVGTAGEGGRCSGAGSFGGRVNGALVVRPWSFAVKRWASKLAAGFLAVDFLRDETDALSFPVCGHCLAEGSPVGGGA